MSKIESLQKSRLVTSIVRFTILCLLLLSFYIVYRTALKNIVAHDEVLVTLFLLWLISAYILIPRLHRWMSKIYLPDYYIGRVKTYDGLLGDPINLAIFGSKQQVIQSMINAGWTQATDLNWKSTVKMILASVKHNSYPEAPVSSLYLFARKQDIAFQIEVNGSPHKRHHVRFWATPKAWWLPGGHKADWLGAATYDRRVGFSTLTGQITHKISAEVDQERDFVVTTLQKSGRIDSINTVKHFTSGYHHRNGGGDSIRTDGALPFITLKK
ncbi:MAG: LssY C-terminal domain-containing protein [Candidatus Saccharibacteria bacterium]